MVEQKESKKVIPPKLRGKTFYHTHKMYQPVNDDSLSDISSQDADDEHVVEAENEAIDSFEYLDDGNKMFFKLWNEFYNQMHKLKNKEMAVNPEEEQVLNIKKFLKEKREQLRKHNLRKNFVMHLTTLNIYALIDKDEILQCLLEYDKQQEELDKIM